MNIALKFAKIIVKKIYWPLFVDIVYLCTFSSQKPPWTARGYVLNSWGMILRNPIIGFVAMPSVLGEMGKCPKLCQSRRDQMAQHMETGK